MPEVCEVCLTAMFLDKKLKNKKITSIKVLSGRYSRNELEGLKDIQKSLPITIIKVNSKGKFLWFEMKNKNDDYYLMNTFGLEGEWGFTKYKHSHIEFTIKSNSGKIQKLYFTDQRNFGTMKFTKDSNELDKKLSMIGDDLLKTPFTNLQFYHKIKEYLKKNNKRADKPIIKVLMDQTSRSGLGSGLGNYLAPEILYRAKISPHTKIGKLFKNRSKVYRLAKTIKYVVKLCYLTNLFGGSKQFDTFLNNHYQRVIDNKAPNYHKDIDIGNDEFEFLVYRQDYDLKGNKVKADKIINGRTTYWVPTVQK